MLSPSQESVQKTQALGECPSVELLFKDSPLLQPVFAPTFSEITSLPKPKPKPQRQRATWNLGSK